MIDYKQYLDDFYSETKDYEVPPISKLDFLGEYIFNFTTYDSKVSELFAKKMIEVIECIYNKTTFDYQKNENNYFNYLTMVNMPFLQGMLEWGTSIRGAWFDTNNKKEFYFMEIDLQVPTKETEEFIKQLIEWSKS